MSYITRIADEDGGLFIREGANAQILLGWGTNTNQYPALIPQGTDLAVKLADNSGYTSIIAAGFQSTGPFVLNYISSNPAPLAGAGQVFAKTDGYLYFENASGQVTQLGTSTGGGGGGTIGGSGSPGQVSFWTATENISGNSNLFWDNTNNRLGIGTAAGLNSLNVENNVVIGSLADVVTAPVGGLVVTGQVQLGGTAATNAQLYVEGGLNLAADFAGTVSFYGAAASVNTVTTTYSVTQDDYTVVVDASTAAFTVNLPDATLIPGRLLNFKKIDNTANVVTIVGILSQTIDAQSQVEITTQFESLSLQSDGATWIIL